LEIEQVLTSHPEVAECAVVGVKTDDAGGEDEVMAVLVLKGGGISCAALASWAEAALPRYAVPRFWDVRGALAKTPTGKIKKQELRQAGVPETAWDHRGAPASSRLTRS
jgi:crotonobetaine/carnitine-CoA ligase